MPPQKNKRKKKNGGRSRTSSQSSVEIQVTQTEVSCTQNQLAQPALVKPRNDFLSVLKSVNARGSWTPTGEEVFTVRQICLYLTEYIKQKELYDPFNPLIVYCQDDPLGKVFGVEKFSRHEALKYVLKQCNQVIPRQKQFTQPLVTSQVPPYDPTKQVETFLSSGGIISNPEVYPPEKCEADFQPRKRQKNSSGSGDLEASTSASLPLRSRQSSLSIVYNTDTGSGENDWSFAVVEIQESGDESVHSVQSKETVFVESSSDDFWFVDDDDDEFSLEMNSQGISFEFNQSTDPPFQEEYEIEEQSFGESGGEYDTDGSESPVEEIFVVYDGSDEDFWADSESSDCESENNTSDDEELCDDDKWQCIQCKFLNTPLRRYCDRCWSLRPNWLLEKKSKLKNEQTDYFGLGHKRAESMETLPASDIDLSDFEPSLKRQYDSGIGGSLAHLSQESNNYTELNPQHKEEIVKSASCDLSQHYDSGLGGSLVYLSQESNNSTEPKLQHEEEIVKSASCNLSQKCNSVLGGSLAHLSQDSKSSAELIMQHEEEIVKSASCTPSRAMVKNVGKTETNPVNKTDVNSAVVNLSVKFSENIQENTQNLSSQKCEKFSTPRKYQNSLHFSQRSPGKIVHSPKKSRNVSESYQDLCTVCMVKPKEASIIHGKTGHQVCCYVCAKRLKRKGKHCPVCRRPIQKVIKNYLL